LKEGRCRTEDEGRKTKEGRKNEEKNGRKEGR
jgi:hypothetical protein